MSNTHKFTIDRRELTTTVIATLPELYQCLKDLLSTITTEHSVSKRVVGLGIEKKFEAMPLGRPQMLDRVKSVSRHNLLYHPARPHDLPSFLPLSVPPAP